MLFNPGMALLRRRPIIAAGGGAVAFDASMTGGNSSDGFNAEASNAALISSNGMTLGGSASIIAAVFVWQSGAVDATVRSATWNGVSMTEAASVTASFSNVLRTSIFYLASPATGNHALAGAWTGLMDCYMSAVSFSGAGGINAGDSATATNVTQITVTSDTNGATVAVFGVDGSVPTMNFTKIFAEAPLNPGGGGTWTLGGTSNIHTFTGAGGATQVLAGIHITT